MTQSVSTKMISSLASAKLTGAMPALDGAALTGLSVALVSNASDPSMTSNPATGIGTIWTNHTSGKTFVLTNATANKNLWENIGNGVANISTLCFGGRGGGTQYGYNAGGKNGPYFSAIDKFAFAAVITASGHGDLRVGRSDMSGSSSNTHGFAAGGYYSPNVAANHTKIDKFAFASNTTAANHGDITTAVDECCASHGDLTHGYSVGGKTNIRTINKYAFATSGGTAGHGDMSGSEKYLSSSSSNTHGYITGGAPPVVNTIQKLAFASTSGTSDAGDLVETHAYGAGFSSNTHGYVAGGSGSWNSNHVQRYSYFSGINQYSIGDLTSTHNESSYSGNSHCGASSSTTNGYAAGGHPNTDTIVTFSFGTDTRTTDHGNLRTAGRGYCRDNQS